MKNSRFFSEVSNKTGRSKEIAISLFVLLLALQYLYRSLSDYQLTHILNHFLQHPQLVILFATSLTACSYLIVTGYDLLALIHLKRNLPYHLIARTAFLASAFGNNFGLALLTGTSVRYRMYSRVGLSNAEIAGVSSLCGLATVLGMGMVFASSMLLQEPTLARTAFGISPWLGTLLGSLVLTLLVGYLLLIRFRPMSLQFGQYTIPLPKAGLVLSQTALATTNLLLVATLMYHLIAPFAGNCGYIAFLGVYSVAVIAGSASNVPGGIGVFESVLLAGLPQMPAEALLGCTLLFRCIYYFGPLILASGILVFTELFLNPEPSDRIFNKYTRVMQSN